jgi:flagellar biosynthesis protein FlhG
MELVYSNKAIDKSKKLKAKVITITSGKGGVGKTSTATNLALSLSALDKKVCVFDADTSLANINILLGIHPEYTLHDLLSGDKTLKQIMVDGPRGLKVIPGATGISEYTHLSSKQKTVLINALDELQQQFDYLIIDTAAGIGDDVLDFVKASQFPIVVITPEPTSLTDSFSLLKVLKRSDFDRTSYILVNMALDFDNSQTIYKRFESAVKKYIEVDIEYLGFIQVDETVISSVSLQCPAVLLSPDCIASRCFKALAKGLNEQLDTTETESFSEYWENQEHIHPEDESSDNKPINRPIETESTETNSLAKPLDFNISALFCTEQLDSGTLDEQYVTTLIEPLIESYYKTYSIQPSPAMQSIDQNQENNSLRNFYSLMEQEGFPTEQLKETVFTLEKIYQEKTGGNLRNFQNNAVLLFSQFDGSQDDLKYLHKQLLDCFQRHFGQPINNLFDELDKTIKTEEFTLDDFDKLITNNLSTYEQRFSNKFKTQADIELEQALLTIDQLQNNNKQLEEQLTSSKKQQTEQSAVIDKIQHLLTSNESNDKA